LPLTPIERRSFDYSALDEAMVHLDAVVRNARNTLRTVSAAASEAGSSRSDKRV
jgi:hypothetical protein